MLLRRTRTRSAVVGLLLLAGFSLSACGSDSVPETESGGQVTSAADPETTPSPSSAESSQAPADAEATDDAQATGAGGQPSWALPVTTPGTKLTTIEVGEVSVDVYQVGTAPAEDTGSFVDPDTNTPLIEVGDTLVFLNYVVTNNGGPIDLGSLLVDVSARYDDWPYLQGMDGLTGDELWDAQSINAPGLAPDGYSEEGIYSLGGGESFSYGDNFEYQPNSPIGFQVTYTPVDAQGELLSDERVEAEGSATIS